MNKLLLFDVLPVVMCIGSLGIFLAYMIIRTPLKYWLKFVGIPLFLATAILTVTTLDSLIGRPLKMYPPDGFMPLGIALVAEPNAKIEDFKMDIWVRDNEEWGTRLYQIPYDPKILQEVKRAIADMEKNGVRMEGRWEITENGDDTVYKPVFERIEPVYRAGSRKPPPPQPQLSPDS